MKLVINRRKIEEARIKKGLNMTELAEKAGVSPMSVCNAINGYVNTKVRTLKKIADALDVDALDIVSVEEDYDETLKRPRPKCKTVVNE